VSSLTSCNVESGTLGVGLYATMLVVETIIVLLTLWKGLHVFFLSKSKHRQSQLMTTFYRDGIAFYLVMFFVLIIVVILRLVAPIPLQSVGETPLRVIHAISACHLVIHAREVANQEGEDLKSGRSRLSGIDFGSPAAAAGGSRRDTRLFA